MKTAKLIALIACGLVALVGMAKKEKYVIVVGNSGNTIDYIKASDIGYMEVVDQVVRPDCPENVVATVSDGKVHLTWDEVDGATYNVHRSSLDQPVTLIAEQLQQNAYTDPEPAVGFNYYFVEAVDEGYISDRRSGAFVSTVAPAYVIGTLCGSSEGEYDIFGPLENAVGFRLPGCLAFDPLSPDRMYAVYDAMVSEENGRIVGIDLEAATHSLVWSSGKFQNAGKRMRNCAFTPDGQYMLVATDCDTDGFHSPSVWIVKRKPDGTFDEDRTVRPSLLAAYRQCNGVAVHPVNGEAYFSSYTDGELFRLDLDEYFSITDSGTGDWTGYIEDGCFEKMFSIADPSLEFNITIHPTGNYAYLNCINRYCIYRTDYDWEKKRFTAPYLVAGTYNAYGFADGPAKDALVSPYQGIFVKNPEYAGQPDEYDYYFTDRNFCVRVLSKDGNVSTIAGRPMHDDLYMWGAEDGDSNYARFDELSGIAYHEATDTFYVLDHKNRRIRSISRK